MRNVLKLIYTLSLIVYWHYCFSQGRDNYWPLGYDSYSGNSSFGGMELTFPQNIAALDTHSRPMSFVFTNAAIGNDTGNILFYTNGVFIANALDDTMSNGNGINPSFYTTQFYNSGLRLPQASVIIPTPGSSTNYYLFHMTEDIATPVFKPGYLYMSNIDMSLDNGLGEVVSKNNILINDTLYPGSLTLTRHGNGRDWWMLVPRWGQDIGYYTLLVTPDTIQQTNYQIFPFDGLQGGQACFSPDGSKYMISYWWGVAFFDFDRCDGTLTFIDNKVFPDSAFCLGASISPNSRYTYVTHGGFEILQYDLQATNIIASEQVVATYDGFQAPAGWNTNFWMHQLGPDGKIYINTTSTTMALHVIDDPDSSGVACDVQQHAILLPHFNATLPNFPNYYLGALTGSICDSLTSQSEPVAHDFRLKIYPNPNDGNFTVGYLQPRNEEAVMRIFSREGKLIYYETLTEWSSIHYTMLPQALPPGLYLLSLTSGTDTGTISFSVIR